MLVPSPDGTSLYLLGPRGLSRLDLAHGAEGEEELVSGVQADGVWASPGGDLAAAAFSDKTGRLIDVESGRSVLSTRFPGDVTLAAFDGRNRVAFASAAGGVRVFDTRSGQQWADVRPGLGVVSRVVFLAEGAWLAIEGSSGLAILRVDPFEELCRRAGANLDSADWSALGGEGPPPETCPDWASAGALR
jgi:WD40 repeat protein